MTKILQIGKSMDSFIIDDDPETFGHSPNSSLPAPFTIDLGCVAKISRVVMFQRRLAILITIGKS